jgi:hypothetical protein
MRSNQNLHGAGSELAIEADQHGVVIVMRRSSPREGMEPIRQEAFSPLILQYVHGGM